MPQPGDSPLRQFTIVSAVYNVDRYLQDFLGSLENQTYGIGNLDIILVDDGSTDGSLATLQSFAAKHPESVRVFTKPNGGQASARNLGLGYARGDWVTFTDPDDFLDRNYFQAVNSYLTSTTEARRPKMLSTQLISFIEEQNQSVDNHPLRTKFRHGSRVIDLDIEPEQIQLHCSSAVFSFDVIREHELRFDERIRPNFEDGHFISRFLLHLAKPTYGVVVGAKYDYRRRADGSSTLSLSQTDPRRFVDVPRFGFLAILKEALRFQVSVPRWLENIILYDLAWYFRANETGRVPTEAFPPEVLTEFHDLVAQIRNLISDDAISSFAIIPISDDLRFALLNGYRPEPCGPAAVRTGEGDLRQRLAVLRYRYSGETPAESVYLASQEVVPVHKKSRAITFYGRTLAYERSLWVSLGPRLSLSLNGKQAFFGNDVTRSRSFLDQDSLEAAAKRLEVARPELLSNPHESIRFRLGKQRRNLMNSLSSEELSKNVDLYSLAFSLRRSSTRKKFARAWVFMDRLTAANDNAEHLYRYVRRHAPGVNAWFVIERSSSDWKRLSDEGFRLIAYGSLGWKLLLLHAEFVISSHVDMTHENPIEMSGYGKRQWRFVYLRHGVMGNDMSQWLNQKQIDLLVATSPGEYESIVSDRSRYKFTTKETKLTGLPRHDALREKRSQVAQADRSVILIVPTWRKSLDTEFRSGKLTDEALRSASLVREYTQLLSSTKLHHLAKEHGCSMVFLPHPRMDEFADAFAAPDNVTVTSYSRSNVQDLLAQSRLVITDYSSLSFEAAVIETPVVYFQFDRAEVFSGGHTYKPGYFDYERDGFGPVCAKLSDVEAAAETILAGGSKTEYAERMLAAFAHHDTDNSRRVFEAIAALNKPPALPEQT